MAAAQLLVPDLLHFDVFSALFSPRRRKCEAEEPLKRKPVLEQWLNDTYGWAQAQELGERGMTHLPPTRVEPFLAQPWRVVGVGAALKNGSFSAVPSSEGRAEHGQGIPVSRAVTGVWRGLLASSLATLPTLTSSRTREHFTREKSSTKNMKRKSTRIIKSTDPNAD